MMLPLRLSPESARTIQEEVARARGREVSFLADVTPDREVVHARAVARGNYGAVLAVARDAGEGGVMIHNHPSGHLEPSDADLAVAARLYDEGLGTVIVNNEADRLYVVVEPPEPKSRIPLDLDRMEAALAPGSPFAEYPGYEDRAGQREMLRFVAQRFNEGHVGLVEAGTGTGKSLAYLLPAAQWAAQNGERTIVSTNTINLQEQLVEKDIALAEGAIGARVKWALVKGRGNYVSIRRARLAAESAPTLFPDDRTKEISGLLDWLDRTDDGSLSDLPFVPSDDVWEEVRSETDACLRAKCPHFQDCYYQRSRRTAAGADLVVVNHSLFFSDLAVRIVSGNVRDPAVLPAYDRVIFDEAHHLEDAATPHLGARVTRAGLFRLLARLDRGGKGILTALDEGLAASSVDGLGPVRERLESKVRPAIEALRSDLGLLFDLLVPWIEERSNGEGLRLGPSTGLEPAEGTAIRSRLEAALIRMAESRRAVGALRKRLEVEEELGSAVEGRLLDLSGVERRLDNAAHALRVGLLPDEADETLVRWLELRRGGDSRRASNVVVAAAPVNLGPVLREHLFGRVEAAVLTSATMATRGDFQYLRSRLGLDGTGEAEAPGTPALRVEGQPAPRPVSQDVALRGPPGTVRGADRSSGVGVPPTDASAAGHVPPEWTPSESPVPELDDPGWEPPRVSEATIPSPFDFERQTRLVVPTDLPDAAARETKPEFHRMTAQVLYETALAADGGVFGLFTSFGALRDVARHLRAQGADGRWPLFVQGEGDRSSLLQAFARDGRGVLLGTSSFWEGVDVPGRPLRALVIHKLPFKVPTEPITAARLEAIEARGDSSFWQYMVPGAALRLKQGVGRLIRSRTDRGVVVLLDDRFLRKRYGRVLRESLPPMPLVKGPWDEVRAVVNRFYQDDA
ncbi:MAG: DEAD/DEAH box helicase [Gemmatimonadetes bacterium]|nr:DEAD/DEAH box helicase [Gemmatimonadota bacterium]